MGAAKQYSQMDRAPFQVVDVHELLDSTLVMLSRKIGKASEVVKDYDRSLPEIPVYGAELNQVWTNLIDNAPAGDGRQRHADHSHQPRRRLPLRWRSATPGRACPAENLSRIFEPFFTTKPVGEGTGLGPGHLVADRASTSTTETCPSSPSPATPASGSASTLRGPQADAAPTEAGAGRPVTSSGHGLSQPRCRGRGRLHSGPGHDDVRDGDRRGGVARSSWTRSWPQAARSSTPQTSTAAGVSEEIIGRWLRARPSDVTDPVVLATKGRFPLSNEPERCRALQSAPDPGAGRVVAAAAGRLGRPLSGACVGPVHAARGDVAHPRRIRARRRRSATTACPTSPAGSSPKAVRLARALGLSTPVTVQPQYNLLVREIEWEIVPAAQDAGLGLLPWSPLGGGWLSGKYRRDERPSGATRLGENPERGVEAYDRRSTQSADLGRRRGGQGVAESRGATMAQVALAWLVDQSGGHLGHPRRPDHGPAGGEPRCRRSEAGGRTNAPPSTPPATQARPTIPYGGPGTEQRSRKLTGGDADRQPFGSPVNSCATSVSLTCGNRP